MSTRPSSGSLTNADRREARLVRSDEGSPHEQKGEDREHGGDMVRTGRARAGEVTGRLAGVRGYRH